MSVLDRILGKISLRGDEVKSALLDDDDWKTINGTHVLFGEEGFKGGPQKLSEWSKKVGYTGGKTPKPTPASETPTAKPQPPAPASKDPLEEFKAKYPVNRQGKNTPEQWAAFLAEPDKTKDPLEAAGFIEAAKPKAEAPKAKAPKAEAPKQLAPPPKIPGINTQYVKDISKWEKVGGQKGSNPGGVYENPLTGREHYVKFPQKNPEQAAAENISDDIYASLGIPVKVSRLITHEGKLGLSSNMLKSPKPMMVSQINNSADVKKGFVADAFLGNWDVFGATHDNIVHSEGQDYRVDNGGTLFFRAQGSSKDFPSDRVDELKSLIEPGRKGHAAYGDLSKEELRKQAETLVKTLTDPRLEEIVYNSELTGEKAEQYLKALKGRRDYIAKTFIPSLAEAPAKEVKTKAKVSSGKLKPKMSDKEVAELAKFKATSGAAPTALSKFVEGFSSEGIKQHSEARSYFDKVKSFQSKVAPLDIKQQYLVDYYLGSSHRVINHFLRGRTTEPLPEEAKKSLETLKEAIKKAPPLAESTMYRGSKIPNADLEKLEKMGVYSDPGIQSGSYSFQTAEGFMDYAQAKPGYTKVLFKMSVPDGAKGRAIGSGEQEVIFEPGRKWKVTKVEKGNPAKSNSYTVVEISYLDEIAKPKKTKVAKDAAPEYPQTWEEPMEGLEFEEDEDTEEEDSQMPANWEDF